VEVVEVLLLLLQARRIRFVIIIKENSFFM